MQIPASTSRPLSPIQLLVNRFTQAENRGQRRLSPITVRARVHSVNIRPKQASFFWLEDECGAALEVVVRSWLHRIIPSQLAVGNLVEVRGALARFRGSDPQLQARWINVYCDASDTDPRLQLTTPSSSASISPSICTRLPTTITRLGLVTSPGSAAYDDVLQVVADRAPWVRVIYAPAAVQADDAGAQMTDAILRLHTNQPAPDAILICRGGSTDPAHLGAFADPLLLAAIGASRIPVVTAIGHARDQTPADLVAAAAFPTPSLAAVALVPDCQQIRSALAEQRQRLERLLGERLPVLEEGTRLALPEEVSRAELLGRARARLQHAEERLHSPGLEPEARAELRYTLAADWLLAHALLRSAPAGVTRVG